MSRKNRVAQIVVMGFVTAASVTVSVAPATAGQRHQKSPGAPVFVQTDAVDGNTVVAYDRQADGSLVHQHVYATGGRGGRLDGAVVDDLPRRAR
ncbi:hypothetical protein ACIRPX_35565 [Streptomyces sp. NPDC101225]|uniref:hypothetical protein n=1 Tax=Streptomyces sp. NPDC101225 TaxID=3366135 RepID=UPI00380C1A15